MSLDPGSPGRLIEEEVVVGEEEQVVVKEEDQRRADAQGASGTCA